GDNRRRKRRCQYSTRSTSAARTGSKLSTAGRWPLMLAGFRESSLFSYLARDVIDLDVNNPRTNHFLFVQSSEKDCPNVAAAHFISAEQKIRRLTHNFLDPGYGQVVRTGVGVGYGTDLFFGHDCYSGFFRRM